MTDTESVGQLIRRSRLEKGMSLSQLAAAIGRSSSSVRRWERGEVPPAIAIVDDLASVLDLEADQLRSSSTHAAAATPGADPSPVPSAAIDASDEAKSSRRPRGILADVIDAFASINVPKMAWMRAALTTGALVVMFVILIWAVGELWDSIREVWNSFGTG